MEFKDGRTVRFWSDKWLSKGRLIEIADELARKSWVLVGRQGSVMFFVMMNGDSVDVEKDKSRAW